MNKTLLCGVRKKNRASRISLLKKKQNIDFPLPEISFDEILYLNEDFLIPKIIFS